QTTLNFETVKKRAESTRETRLKAISEYVVIEDQALMTADKITFRNILYSAKPDLKKSDLPSSHDVVTYIQNRFVDHIEHLKKELEVSFF
ncbi:hypothetical protein M378DRAFT_53877, partial [Amanita muscaria Koide BX008]